MAGGIDIKVTELGGPEVAATFARAQSGLRAQLQQELDEIGQDIVIAARSGVARRTGATMRRIIHRHGRQVRRGWQHAGDDRLILTVLPGEPLGHLIERGVDATISRRRNRAADVRGRTKTGRKSRKLIAVGVKFVKPYRLTIAPRPYFEPAIDSVGGPSGVNARLQATIGRVAAAAERGA